jgi:periplasmic protein TonB
MVAAVSLLISIQEGTMFADSLYDSGSNRHSRRSWTTLVSFALQVLAVSGLLTLPFLSTQGLPALPFVTHLMVPVAAGDPAPVPQTALHGAASSLYVVVTLERNRIPNFKPTTDGTNTAPPDLPFGQSNARSGDDPAGVADAMGNGPMPELAPAPVSQRRTSVMMEGNLIRRVQPQYPPLAVQTHTQGSVVLSAVISRAGTIENLQVLSGHPMLVKAAIDAVRQWRYRPYVLNGDPVEVDTQVTVNFTLGGG